VLSFFIAFTIGAVWLSVFIKNTDENKAVQITQLYAELAKNEGLSNEYITSYILCENGTVIDIDTGIISLLIDRVSIQTAERISEFIREPEGFYTYNTGVSYIGILPFDENDERRLIFVEVPLHLMPFFNDNLTIMLLLIGLAGLALFVVIVFYEAKRNIKCEKEVADAQIEEEIQEHEQPAEEEEETQEAPDRAMNMQTAFFGRISHEIRTPMNSILGIAQILLADSRLSESQLRYINDIKSSTSSLLKTINDSLDFSLLSAGELPLNPRDYNFIQLVDSVSAYTRSVAEQKGLTYNFNVHEKLPQCLYGDSERLKQLLTNIIDNAVKFTKDGSITFNIASRNNNLLFVIHDTGLGIHPESENDLFDPFTQSQESVLRVSEGAGLGLPIAKGLAALMNGDITFNSEYGAGSTFMVTIPKSIGNSAHLKAVTTKSDFNFSTDARILVVDDNEINLNVAEGLITMLYGMECDIVLSGEEALAYFEKHDYNLIFMDHMMPEMDGVETTARIREKNTEVPIIALTANAIPGTKEMLIEAGMNDLLSKPIVIDEMSKILQKWLPAKKFTALDINAGLAAVAHNEEIYESSLKLLYDKIPKILAILEICLSENNLPDFTLHIHGMKSSLAAVGAVPLSELAETLENAGNAKDAALCRRVFPEFLNDLKALEQQLASRFAAEVQLNKKAGTREVLNECLDTLTEAVANYNYELLINTVTAMSELDFGMEINSDTAKIKILADNFDYDGIIGAVKELKYELKNKPELL
jgi:signal transduction histidine kinase/DNA-binding NarL/FixJ family response regulator